VFDRVWSCLIKFEGQQAFDQKRKTIPLFSCLMGDVLFDWTAAYQTCLMVACVPRLLSGLYQLFHLCLIKHVLTVWTLTSKLACLVTKQCLLVFGRQTFIVCPGPDGQEEVGGNMADNDEVCDAEPTLYDMRTCWRTFKSQS